MLLLLTERDLRQCVSVDRNSLRCVEAAFAALASGEATVPPPMALEVPERHGEVHIKSARIKSSDKMVVKLASGFFDNASKGLPTSSGLMVVMSSHTGFLEAVLLDNGYLTEMRTALAGAIAAKYMARQSVTTVGMIGVGSQARYQLRALTLVRQVDRVLACGRRPEAAEEYATEMSDELGVDVKACADSETTVRESDVVVTTTPSRQPIVKADWIHPGVHITAVGSDGPDKQELDPAILARADHVVCDLISQCAFSGELHHALSGGFLNATYPLRELGQLVLEGRPIRRNDDEVTVCDLTGVGVQDAAIADYACQRAAALGLGTRQS